MPEIKALTLVYDAAHPLTEVGVTQLPLVVILYVPLLYQLFKVFNVDISCTMPEESEDVFGVNRAIIVKIKVQKGPSNGDPLILESKL